MVVFIIGNALAASATTVGVLLIARVISALAHGIFMSIGATIAADLVPENRRASAIAIMFTGLTVATVTGVPLEPSSVSNSDGDSLSSSLWQSA